MLKPWGDLTESRRGWALGGAFGLAATTLFFSFYGRFNAQFFFSLATLPALPGVFLAEHLLPIFLPTATERALFFGRLLLSFSAAALNYIFWGAYTSFLYHAARARRGPLSASEIAAYLLLSLGLLFFASVGIGYGFSLGLTIQDEPSPPFLVLTSAFFLALLGFGNLFVFLVSFFNRR